MNWLKENGIYLIFAVLAFCLISFWLDTNHEYRMKKLESDQAIKVNKAEEGIKLKFGITKEQ